EGEQTTADLELGEQRLRQERQTAGNDDDVVGRARGPAPGGIAVLDDDVLDAVAGEVLVRQLDQGGLDVDRAHPLGPRRQQGGEVAGTGTDLEHRVGFLQLQRLQNLALDHRLQHDLPATDRDLDVGEGERARA